MSGEHTEGAGFGTLFLVFVAGVLVGAAGATLLAPGSGGQTRERLADAAASAGERARRARDAARAAIAAAGTVLQEAVRQAEAPSTALRKSSDA